MIAKPYGTRSDLTQHHRSFIDKMASNDISDNESALSPQDSGFNLTSTPLKSTGSTGLSSDLDDNCSLEEIEGVTDQHLGDKPISIAEENALLGENAEAGSSNTTKKILKLITKSKNGKRQSFSTSYSSKVRFLFIYMFFVCYYNN